MKDLFLHFNPPGAQHMDLSIAETSQQPLTKTLDLAENYSTFSVTNGSHCESLLSLKFNPVYQGPTFSYESLVNLTHLPSTFSYLGAIFLLIICFLCFYLISFCITTFLVMIVKDNKKTFQVTSFTTVLWGSFLSHWAEVHNLQPRVIYNHKLRSSLKVTVPLSERFAILFLSLVIINLGGMFYGSYCLTTNPLFTLTLSTAIWFGSVVALFKNFGSFSLPNLWKSKEMNYLKEELINYRGLFMARFFPAGTPLWLGPLIVPVEILSLFIRPLSMGVRIFANLVAGHTIMSLILLGLPFIRNAIILSSSFFLLKMNGVIPIGIIYSVYCTLFGFELAVAIVQAYVLTLLASTFYRESVELY